MKTRILILSSVIALGLVSCKKEVEPTPEPPASTESFSSLQEYLSTKNVATESFSFLAENGGTFTTAKGSVITVPAGALIDQLGNSVTGSVTLEFREIFSNSDIMFSGIFPTSYGSVLNSGGEFKITFEQAGNQLRVANGQMIDVVIPAQAQDPGMMLFFADDIALDSLEGWGQPVDTSFTASGFTFNSTDDTYELTLDSLGWCNIDGFLNSVQYFDVTFNLAGVSGLDNSNTTAFAVFKNENAVWPVGDSYYGSITGNTISESHLADVPMNVVVISVVGGQLYYGLLDVTPVDGVAYTINMQETTSANLDSIIEGLE